MNVCIHHMTLIDKQPTAFCQSVYISKLWLQDEASNPLCMFHWPKYSCCESVYHCVLDVEFS